MKKKNKFYKQWYKTIINKDYTFEKVIKNLNLTALQICLVTEKNKKLIGTITDGDIRRALLSGCSINDKINKYINYKPKKIFEGFTNNQLKTLLEKYQINVLPIVNKMNEVTGLVSWNDFNTNKNIDNFIEPIIFLVGGKGRRLSPITKKIPKPMIKIDGVPILEKLILKARSEGFNNFFFIINYLGNKIIKYFGNGKKLRVNIRYIKEKKPLGTAGGLGLENFGYKTVLVSNGDVLTKVSYKNLLSYHQNNKNELTIGVKNIKTVNPYGVIKFTKSQKKVINLIEKPVYNNFVNAGVYVFETKLFSFIKKNNYLDMTSLINYLIKKNKKIGVCPIHEDWIDIGSHSDLNKVIDKNE
jgi:dTDP-glucose pyrophosphorylase